MNIRKNFKNLRFTKASLDRVELLVLKSDICANLERRLNANDRVAKQEVNMKQDAEDDRSAYYCVEACFAQQKFEPTSGDYCQVTVQSYSNLHERGYVHKANLNVRAKVQVPDLASECVCHTASDTKVADEKHVYDEEDELARRLD
jgi:hypothetical protein